LERSRYVHSTVRNRLPRRAAELGRWFPKREIALGRGAVRLQGRVLASCQQARASSAGAQGYDGVVRLLYGLPRVDLRPTQTHALSSRSLGLRGWPAARRRSDKSGAQAPVCAQQGTPRMGHAGKPCSNAGAAPPARLKYHGPLTEHCTASYSGRPLRHTADSRAAGGQPQNVIVRTMPPPARFSSPFSIELLLGSCAFKGAVLIVQEVLPAGWE